MITNVSHVIPLAKIRRQQLLPVPGNVRVRTGQSVRANDVIAEANLHPEHMLLDIARSLGVDRGDAGRYIKRKVREAVSEGSVIAEKGRFGRIVRAPAAGRIVAISGGQVMLEFNNQPFLLLAGVSGTVTQVKVDYGATIEATGGWIQGAWGNGQLALGGLMVLADDQNHVLTPELVDPSQRGAIIFAGHCSNPNVLELAAANQWRGLILGSMSSTLIPAAQQAPFPVIVLEGFGKIPVNAPALRLLSSNAQREVVLNTMTFNPLTKVLPEVTIPIEAEQAAVPADLHHLEKGLRVRILRAPEQGSLATLNQLIPGLTLFPNGLRALAAEVTMDDGDRMAVPVANIEVIG